MTGPQPSKQFRWVGTLSEEELLGIPASFRHAEVDAIPIQNAQPPPRRPLHPAPGRARRPHRRDVVAVLAVGAAVWLAIGGVGSGLRSSGATPYAPKSVGSTTSSVVAERDEIASLPRFFPARDEDMGTRGPGQTQHPASETKGGKHDPSPPPGGDGGGDPTEPPLVEVTVPGVGDVVVEQPDPPALPDLEDVLPATPTVELP
jgi:hypothetical protein